MSKPLTDSTGSDLHNLLYWLANEDIYTSPYVRNWLKRTPPDEAADILARIARNAQPETTSLGNMLFQGMVMMFTTSAVITDKSPSGRKAGTRAAMLLANSKDFRSLPPLTRVFETRWFWAGKYQEAIEASLLRLLEGAEDRPEVRQYAEDLRRLAEKIWNSGQGRSELSRRLTDLLLATLTCLYRIGEEPGLSLLKTISSSRASTPNRKRVKESVVAMLNSAG